MQVSNFIGFDEALRFVVENVRPSRPELIPVSEGVGFVIAEDLQARVSCPSLASSLKDGYAVVSKDVENASDGTPSRLRVIGRMEAGTGDRLSITPGHAVEVTTGAPLPEGADAVLAVEFTHREGDEIICYRDAGPGRNILAAGADAALGETVAIKGTRLTPPLVGLAAASGVDRVSVFPRPKVSVLATGTEIVAPGLPLRPGQLYASNMVTLRSWLKQFNMECSCLIAPDEADAIRDAAQRAVEVSGVLITSGGAWKSDRDLTVNVLRDMGLELLFRRVRMGPGKAAAFGFIEDTPVFCLPGGPPSNEMAFLQLALPGLLAMAGLPPEPFSKVEAVLTEEVSGDEDWTQFIHADWVDQDRRRHVTPIGLTSRLQSQARATALIRIPEGTTNFRKGEEIEIQILHLPMGLC